MEESLQQAQAAIRSRLDDLVAERARLNAEQDMLADRIVEITDRLDTISPLITGYYEALITFDKEEQ